MVEKKSEIQNKFGQTVVVTVRSHDDHKGAMELLPEALDRLGKIPPGFSVNVIDFGRIIGKSHCVETTEADEPNIYYKVRPNRKGPSRFVAGREPEPCSKLTVILLQQKDSEQYVLITAFVGGESAVEDFDPAANDDSRAFWRTHALIEEQ